MIVAERFKQFHYWFDSLHGQRLLKEISLCMNLNQSANRFLQLGSCGSNPWLLEKDILVSPYLSTQTNLVADPYHLPFAHDSFDGIFLPFSFDLGMNLNDLSLEIDRILVSMGQVLILGLNPTGLWRLSRFFNRQDKQWYQSKDACSYWHLSSRLKQLGYVLQSLRFFYYLAPTQNKQTLKYFEWVNHFAKIIAPYPPSMFILQMQKQSVRPLPIFELQKSRLC